MLSDEPEGGGRKARARISAMTVGKVVDYGLKDSMNMGACMAPAAASTLEQHFTPSLKLVLLSKAPVGMKSTFFQLPSSSCFRI